VVEQLLATISAHRSHSDEAQELVLPAKAGSSDALIEHGTIHQTIHVLPGIWPLAFRRRHIYTPSMVDKTQRRLAAILAADVAGYTRLVEQDTDCTVAAWKSARDNVIKPLVDKKSGHIINFTGDGFLVEFPSVQDAVACAITLQDELRSSSLNFRIGINVGDITDDGGDVHGEGVNIAALPGDPPRCGRLSQSTKNLIFDC
jgi:hypothetical protein